ISSPDLCFQKIEKECAVGQLIQFGTLQYLRQFSDRVFQRKRLKQRAQPVKRDMIRIQVSDDLTLHTMASSLEEMRLASNTF
ncbi:MAG: hypothetical protein ACOX85_11975, partial [Candidatus Pararuminococcus gallinarum]